MAAAKKPAKKGDSKKLADVAKPGTTTPDATARPIIVTNRPILQDPMVVEEASSADDTPATEATPATPSSAKVTIKPISVTDNTASEAPTDEAVKTEDTETEPEADTSIPVKIDSKTTKKIIKPIETEPLNETSTSPEDTTSADTDDEAAGITDKSAELPNGAEQTDAPEESPEAETLADENEETDEASTDTAKVDTPEAADAAAKKAAEEETKHNEAIEKIAESKQYFLPIKTEEQRKTARFALLGTLLIVVLGLAWLDVALDAGLIQFGSVKPLTHFFSQQTAPNVPTAATPVVTNKTFTAPIAKISFRYPSDWQLDSSGNTTKSDTVNMQPKTVRAESLTGINVIFLSLPVANPSATFSLKTVHYQKLARPIGDKTVYLVDIVYQDAAGKFNVTSSLTNDNLLKAGQAVTSLEQNFMNADGKTNYFGVTLPNVSGGLFTFDSADDAKALLTTHQYQQARAILLSATTAKS